MEFGLKKCSILIFKKKEDLSLLGDNTIGWTNNDGGWKWWYKYLGIVELNRVKEQKMRKQLFKKYEGRLKK